MAAELSVQARTLQERYPGARVQAPRQKGAHIERQPRLRRMDDGALADANKAEAATTQQAKASKLKLKSSKPKLGSSHVLVACLGKTAFLKKLSFPRS